MSSTFIYPGLLEVQAPETLSMTTADGVRLDADVYRPVGTGRFPVLLMRQAYGRRIACTLCYAHPSWYAAHGYLVVVQDIRGRGTSEGTFHPGRHEEADGAAAVEWAAQLPGSDGQVGMYGFSYQGCAQLLAATGDCPSLKAVAPAMAPWDIGRGWMYENGAMQLKQMVEWGVQISAEASRRQGDAQGYAQHKAFAAAPNWQQAVSAQPSVLTEHAGQSHYQDWRQWPVDDANWAAISPYAKAEQIAARALPTLLIGGWFDTFINGTLAAFHELTRLKHPALRLVVGPWLHFPWRRHVGGVDFGPEADLNTDALHIAFFDEHLKGIAPAEQSRIRLFDMGTLQWRTFADWPTQQRALYLQGTGRASMDVEAGTLADQPVEPGCECVVHDPWRPAPAVGGCFGVVPGPVDRSAVDYRGDVLTFTSPALSSPLVLAGDLAATLSATCDRRSFDVSCVFSRVLPSGVAQPLSSGYVHLRQVPEAPVQVPMVATCVTLQPGERIRLSIAASDFPAHPINPGTGQNPMTSPAVEALVTTIVIRLGGADGSFIELPFLAS